MADFDDINDMIRKELESDKNRVDSISIALTERLEALVKSLIERTIKLGKRQFFVSIPMSLDNSYYPDYYDEDESPVWIARKHIRDEDWTGHLSTTFDIKLTNQFERINFQMIIDFIEGIFQGISVETIYRFGKLSLWKSEKYTWENHEQKQGYEMDLTNHFRDNDGDWCMELTFPDFFVKKSDNVPVFFVSTKFELRGRSIDWPDDVFSCLPVYLDNEEGYSHYSGFFHLGRIREIDSDEYATVTNTSEWIERRINYFIQFK